MMGFMIYFVINMRFLRFLRFFEKWSELFEKWSEMGKIGKNACPSPRISLLLLLSLQKYFFPEKKYYLYPVIAQHEGGHLSLQYMPFIVD